MPETLTEEKLDRQWHTLAIEEVTETLESEREGGLTDEKAHQRHERFGPNELNPEEGPKPLDAISPAV